MKRRVLLLLGATGMSAASVLGTGVVTATPAAAQLFNPAASFGYVLGLFGCVFGGLAQPASIGPCLRANLRGLLGTLGLPTGANNNSNSAPAANARPTRPALPGGNAPQLRLPANVTGFLRTLPPALQTNPVAPAASPAAPTRQLVKLPSLSRGLSTSAPTAPTLGSRFNLPKLPTAADIKLFNIADHAPANSASPVSGADVLQLLALGGLGAAGVTAATRRRMAVANR